MKKRHLSRVLNIFAFNLLFFALYLNFIHKDSNAQVALPAKTYASPAQAANLGSPAETVQHINKTEKEPIDGNHQLSFN